MVNLDKLIPELGGFGYYQKKLLLLLIFPIASCAMFMIITVFALYTPNHRCKPPGVQDSRGTNASFDDLFVVSECNIQQIIEGPVNSTDSKRYNDSHHMIALPCMKWDYDDDVFVETFTTTHNLVCDDTVKISHAQMIFYFGVVVGDLLFGQLSDYIGRKKTLFIAMFLLFIFGISASWSPEYYTFVSMQFVVGAACRGCSVLIFVTGLEFVGPSIRVWIGQYFNIFFALGLCALSGIGLLIKNWQYIQIASSVPVVFLMSYWFLIDESPRWLLSKGRMEEAKIILQKIARVNNVTPAESLFEQLECDEDIRTERIWSLFKNRILAGRTLVVFFNWFAVGMAYYGVFLYVENLGGNFYLAIFLLSVIELPVLFLNLYLLNRFGRKKVHCVMMLMGGLACICTIFPVTFGGDGLQPLILALAVMGKMGASGAFGSIYVISGELFPTVIRNGAVGASSSCARIASMLAPYIAKLGTNDVGSFGKAIPLIIFGVCSIAAGLSSLYLPETMGCRLPDTIEDAVDFELLREDQNQDNEIAELRTMNEKQS